MIEKIISDGQTGVDQAALDAATDMGIKIGGCYPLGGLDENNKSFFKKYPFLMAVTGVSLKESIAERTKRNIDSSDGTLIVVPATPMPQHIADGALLTIQYTKETKKLYLLIALDDAIFRKKPLIFTWFLPKLDTKYGVIIERTLL